MDRRLYSMTDAASAAGISTPTLCRRIAAGKGPQRVRIGRAFVVTDIALRDWLATLS